MALPEWLWIVVEQQGNVEHLFGQYDEEKDTYYIPAFYDRENAEACLPLMQKVPNRSYEIQAMRAAEVTKVVRSHSYQLLILDGRGRVLETIDFS